MSAKKNGGYCIHKDDTNTMLQKISDADCIVFGTPVFWIGMAGQLKLFIDKFLARQNVLRTQPKKAASLVVGGGLKANQYALIQEQFACICKFLNWNHIHAVSFSAFGLGDILKKEDFESKIQETADAIN